jgi:hypothetical protein
MARRSEVTVPGYKVLIDDNYHFMDESERVNGYADRRDQGRDDFPFCGRVQFLGHRSSALNRLRLETPWGASIPADLRAPTGQQVLIHARLPGSK